MSAIRLVRALAVALLLGALASLLTTTRGTAVELSVAVPSGLPAGPVALGLHLDVLASVLLAYVSTLVWLVARFSGANLAGQRRTRRFGLVLLGLLAGLVLLVAGASLPVVALGWTLTGLGVAALVAHPASPAALRAAGRVRRALLGSDLALWAAVVTALVVLPSTDRADLLALGSEGVAAAAGPTAVLAVALGLVLAGVVRSALVPAHRWLPETAEGPSPVSALLHAGVVNATAVVVALFWPVVAAAPLALVVLLAAGAASVAVGTLTVRHRPDVKGRLAASTTAQMGYMSVQLGLGLPAAAVLHLIGHGAYKSWLFLRAGGTVTRLVQVRTPAPAARAAARGTAAAALGLGLLAVAGLPALAAVVAGVGATALAPALLAATTVVVAARHAARSAAGWRHPLVVGAGAGTAGAVYLWLLLGLERFLAPALAPDAVWGTALALLLVGALVLGGAVTALLVVRRANDPAAPGLVTRLVLDGLPRELRVLGGRRGDRRGPAGAPASTATPTAAPAAVGDAERARALVGEAAAPVAPGWPLRAAVAANPLATLETLPLEQAAEVAERDLGVQALLPLSGYARLVRQGRLTRSDLVAALRLRAVDLGAGTDLGAAARTADAVLLEVDQVGENAGALTAPDSAPTTGATPDAGGPAARVDAHAALWTALAWSRTDVPSTGPWTLWRAHAAGSTHERLVRVPGSAALVAGLPERADAALAVLLGRLGLDDRAAVRYLRHVLLRQPGWASHAAWRWRELHGAPTVDGGPLVQLTALRVALDVLVADAEPAHRPWDTGDGADGTGTDGTGTDGTDTGTDTGTDDVHRVDDLSLGASSRPTAVRAALQTALEVGVQDDLLRQLGARATGLARAGRDGRDGREPVEAMAVLCIDVRSERLRRALEEVGPYRTFGAAGFFGAAVRAEEPGRAGVDLCPVLVRPSVTVRAEQADPARVAGTTSAATTAVGGAPLTPLLLAEAGGALAGVAGLARTLAPAAWSRVVRRWEDGDRDHRWGARSLGAGTELATRVGIAEGFLRSIGLVEDVAPVLLVVGHGARVENNAFASAYDCGACGANPGHVNARVVVDALQDPAVRQELAGRGIDLGTSVALAAAHCTTTDTVDIDPDQVVPEHVRAEVDRLREALHRAGARARAERLPRLPGAPSGADEATALRHVLARAGDWSQPSPEWGLSGNAAFVIGPRELTAGLDLDGRVFLHSYDPDRDEDGSVLTTLLTAPLVVVHWISSQYLASTVDPVGLGAGDKTTHNVVGDVGVVTGARGDLRRGLPWQALFAGDPGAGGADALPLALHEPLRPLAVVWADPEAVLRVVRSDATLRALVGGGWVRVAVLDPTDGRAHRVTRLLSLTGWDQVSRDRAEAARWPVDEIVLRDLDPRPALAPLTEEQPAR